MVVLDERLLEPLTRELVAGFETSLGRRLEADAYRGLRAAFPDIACDFPIDPIGTLEEELRELQAGEARQARMKLWLGMKAAISPHLSLGGVHELISSYETLLIANRAQLELEQDYLLSLAGSIKALSLSRGVPAADIAANQYFEADVLLGMYGGAEGFLLALRGRQQHEQLWNMAVAHQNVVLSLRGLEIPEEPLPLRALQLKHTGELVYFSAALAHNTYIR